MENVILVNGKKIIDKQKEGRNSWLFLDDGSKIGSSSIYNKPIEIECHDCKKLITLNFYGTLFTRTYICQSCGTRGEKNPFYGKKHNDEFKEKLSSERRGVWCVGDKNGMFGVNVWDSYSEERRDYIKKKISDGQIGEKNQFFGKTHSEDVKKMMSNNSKQYCIDHPDHIAKMTAASLKKQSQGFKSSIEQKVQNELNRRMIKNKYSKILHRKFQFDFIIGDNILLEVNGDFWHANSRFYGEGGKPLCDVQKKKIELDNRKRSYAEEYGYKIFYIWEFDINNGDFGILDEIEYILKT